MYPTPVYTNDSITATAILSDSDGSLGLSALYEWHVVQGTADIIVQSGPDNSIDGQLHFDSGESVYVVVIPEDNVAVGNPVTSASLLVFNTAPGSAVVEVLPDPAIANQDDLVCSITQAAPDDDGDTLVYDFVWQDPTSTIVQTTLASSFSPILSVFRYNPATGPAVSRPLMDSQLVERARQPHWSTIPVEASDFNGLDAAVTIPQDLKNRCG